MTNIITVHRPQLTEEERARRMKQIKEAAARLVIANEERKAQANVQP
jgi:ribosome recycling factor